jgi:hypothetical protein
MTASFVLAMLLALPPPRPAAGPAQPQTVLTDAQIRERVETLLGNIDTRLPAERWKELGPRAAAVLLPIIQSQDELPSRRAAALRGLILAAPEQAAAPSAKLAVDEKQPVAVRVSAMRAVAATTPSKDAAEVAAKVLATSRHPGVRGVAAEIVAASGSEGCAQVKAQAAREDAAQKAAFRRALARCGE